MEKQKLAYIQTHNHESQVHRSVSKGYGFAKILLLFLVAVLSCQTLPTQKPVSIFIAYDDDSVLMREDVCREFFSFRKKFKEQFPGSNLYYYRLPAPNMIIGFKPEYLSRLFNTDYSDSRKVVDNYFFEIENSFPEIEKSLVWSNERPEINLTLPSCEYPEEISEKIKDISVDHQGHRVPLYHLARIELRREDIPESLERYQIKIKIIMKNDSVSEYRVREYLEQMKTLERYKHEIIFIYSSNLENKEMP